MSASAPRHGWLAGRWCCAVAVLLVTSACAGAAHVAVLVEPGLPPYGGTPALTAPRVVSALRRFGLAAEPLTAEQAGDPKRLDSSRLAVLVVPYGNAFPLSSFEQLRAFHRAGGCLVVTGVPFCHPCRRETPPGKGKATWRDLGHRDYFGHDDLGIGTGGFAGPLHTPAPVAVRKGNPLGLTDAVLPRPTERPQWLDVRTLAPEDEVLPLVELRAPGQPPRPVAALIRHKCRRFAGARDVWLGQAANQLTLADRHAATQLIVRGVAWCLLEKGKLTAPQFADVLARLDAEPTPAPLPDQLDAAKQPRPWGDTFFPKSKPPARTLQVVDVQRLSPAERLALVCLQGLTSREQPRLWLLHSPWDQRWLEWHKAKGHIDGWARVDDWRALFAAARGVRGAVVPDAKLYRGELLACNLAAVEDCIVAPEPLAKALGLAVRHDLRGRFASYADGLDELWRAHGPRFNHHLCAVVHPRLAWVLGYDIQWRGFTFWVSGESDGDLPGADPLAERAAMARILGQMPPNTGLRGFPAHGRGAGMGEIGGVRFCGSYGKVLVCTNLLPNVAVMSGVRLERLAPPPPLPAPKLQRDRVYIALTLSDGDNLNTFHHYFRRYFEHPAHGTFPIGWGMGPTILDLTPAIAQWFYEHARPGDEFLADVSGIGYVFPDTYASRFRDRTRILDDFYAWTARYMRRLGMRTIRHHGGDRAALAFAAERLPFVHSIFPDYARRPGMTHARGVYRLANGTPVFHALTHWNHGKDGLLRDIRDHVGTQRPAFVNAFLHNWTFDMDSLARAVKGKDADMVFVTPSQLAALYEQAHPQAHREE
ncbi:hypothetical protein HQ576_14475 [bacterium]|nr:hypothetical protein [bacterium]